MVVGRNRSAAALVLLASIASCSSQRAAPPSPPEPVDVSGGEAREPEPEAAPDPHVAMRKQLLSCWLQDPYPYMFDEGPGLKVAGRRYGMFMAGISGILYYGDLNECAAEITGTEKRSYNDNAPFAELSDLPIYSEHMHDGQPFGFYNPELIEWGHRHLVPDPDTRFAGVHAQELYDAIFSRFFRLMTVSHRYLTEQADYAQEMDAYWEMARRRDPHGIEWLQQRYAGALPQHETRFDGTRMTPQMAIGFWLRRGIDGTQDELWKALRDVMQRYDGDWLASLSEGQ